MKMSIFFSVTFHLIVLLSFGLYITRCGSQPSRINDEIEVENPSNFEKDNKFIVPIPEKRGAEVLYKVKYKDSVEKISAIFKIRTYQLRDKNNLEMDETIHPGQILNIPKIKWKTYEGDASWYGPGFHGKRMANGAIYNQNKISVAHRHYPLGLLLKITNLENGAEIIAPVFGRGPYVEGRELDLSYGAAKALKAINRGVISVRIQPLG